MSIKEYEICVCISSTLVYKLPVLYTIATLHTMHSDSIRDEFWRMHSVSVLVRKVTYLTDSRIIPETIQNQK